MKEFSVNQRRSLLRPVFVAVVLQLAGARTVTAEQLVMRAAIDQDEEGAQYELRVRASGLPPSTELDVTLSAGDAVELIGRIETEDDGRGEFELQYEHDDALPLGLASAFDLEGKELAILGRDGSTTLLAGPLPAPVVDADDDGDGDGAGAGFYLPEVNARPGATIAVPFEIHPVAPVSIVSFSVEYDPRILEFVEPIPSAESRALMRSHPESESRIEWYTQLDDENEPEEEPDDHGGEEADGEVGDDAWLQVSLILDFEGRPEFSIPPTASFPVAELVFRIVESAPAGSTELEFSLEELAGYEGHFSRGGKPVYNAVGHSGVQILPIDPLSSSVPATVHPGRVHVAPIMGDIGFFVLVGDANHDNRVDISDPLRILETLFGGSSPPWCLPAADANEDDGVDISDAVQVLTWLFVEAGWTAREIRVSTADPRSAGCY